MSDIEKLVEFVAKYGVKPYDFQRKVLEKAYENRSQQLVAEAQTIFSTDEYHIEELEDGVRITRKDEKAS